jgi:hypothetical protein
MLSPGETKRELVEQVLEKYPDARRDNRYLLFRAWEIEGLVLTEEQWKKIGSLSQPETLRRTRALIQHLEE